MNAVSKRRRTHDGPRRDRRTERRGIVAADFDVIIKPLIELCEAAIETGNSIL